MGLADDWRCEAVQAAIRQGLEAVVAAGKCAGTLALTAEDERRYAAHGARYFATVASGLITQAFRAAAHLGEDPARALRY